MGTELPPQPAASGTKKCPACAEEIKVDAVVCRFCGFNFQTLTRPGPLVPAGATVKTNGFAIASLVLGVVWVYGLGSILALVFGYMGKQAIDRSGGSESGRGLAVAGIVLGWIGVGITILIIIVAIAGASSNPYG